MCLSKLIQNLAFVYIVSYQSFPSCRGRKGGHLIQSFDTWANKRFKSSHYFLLLYSFVTHKISITPYLYISYFISFYFFLASEGSRSFFLDIFQCRFWKYPFCCYYLLKSKYYKEVILKVNIFSLLLNQELDYTGSLRRTQEHWRAPTHKNSWEWCQGAMSTNGTMVPCS